MIADKERIRFLEAALAEALEELRNTYYFATMVPEGNGADSFALGGRIRPLPSSSKKANGRGR